VTPPTTTGMGRPILLRMRAIWSRVDIAASPEEAWAVRADPAATPPRTPGPIGRTWRVSTGCLAPRRTGSGAAIYGLVLTLVGMLVEAGAIHLSAGADHRALAWHAYLWDPWFLIWGLLVAGALRRRRQLQSQAEASP
jgi:hypothetical protein